ncbi:MAG TPA: hypothetical protein VGH15_08300 [Caulobacteraceae bacterium]
MTTKILTGDYAGVYDLTAPVTTLSITAAGYLGAGLAATGAGAYTVVNAGEVVGYGYAVTLAGGGSLTNSGAILSTSTLTGAGVIFAAAGTVANSGQIRGFDGVDFSAGAGTVGNGGTILAANFGVDLAAGGRLVNGSLADTSALIAGKAGFVAGAAAEVVNYGTMSGISLAGAYFKAGGSFANGGGKDTTATILGSIGVAVLGAAGTVTNAGTIRSLGTAGAAVVMSTGGRVTNGAPTDTTALMIGATGIDIEGQSGTVINYGAIDGGTGTSMTLGGVLLAAGGDVTNGSVTDTAALIDGRAGVEDAGKGGTIRNFATIGGAECSYGAVTVGGAIINGSSADTKAVIEGDIAVGIVGLVGSVINFGSIRGGGGANVKEAGVYITNGGALTNGSSTDTTASVTGLIGVFFKGGTGAAANFGDIGDESCLYGVYLGGGGLVTNGSSTDTGAVIEANVGLLLKGAGATVRNFGTIRSGLSAITVNFVPSGVIIADGGTVTNGAAGDAKASISGAIGVYGEIVAATVSNFGSIVGTQIGVDLAMGGKLTNEAGALISGRADGVLVGAASGTVSNLGTILAGAVNAVGVYLQAGGVLANGSATDHAALIRAHYGVVTQGASTVTNFATLQGVGGYAVQLLGAGSRLNAQAGSRFIGTIAAGSALVDVVGGVSTATAISTNGKIEGAGTLALSGGVSYFAVGTSLLAAEIEMLGAATVARIEAKLVDTKVWDQTAGTLFVDSGDQITFTGNANAFSGTITGLGAVLFSGGHDSFSNLTIATAKTTINKAAVTFSGAIDITGTVTATSDNLTVAVGGATLSGGGELLLSNLATNIVHGTNSAATLTNQDTIRGAGHLGDAVMTLINDALIESGDPNTLFLNTSANTILNAGTILALKGGGLEIGSDVNNTGTLATAGGTLIANGSVTGAGTVHIVGGEAYFAEPFNETVTFGSTGTLILQDSAPFSNTIAGFSHTGTTALELRDIASATATAKYSGTTTGGVLTVTDGTHTAHIHFTGNYLAATWTLSADGSGGVKIVDPTTPKPHIIIAAMAGMGAAAPGGSQFSHGNAHTLSPPVVAARG